MAMAQALKERTKPKITKVSGTATRNMEWELFSTLKGTNKRKVFGNMGNSSGARLYLSKKLKKSEIFLK